MGKFLCLFLCFLLTNCALTAPDGVKELMDDIDRDRNIKKRDADLSFEGKPMFVKVRAYPQVAEGNIYGKQWVLLQIGREKVDLDQLMNDIEEN